jgi:hypothetical protein
VYAGVPHAGNQTGSMAVSHDDQRSFDHDRLRVICSKFAIDTNVSEYISNEEFIQVPYKITVNWFADNKFQLNPIKRKEIVINFQRNEPGFSPITINGT